MYLHTLFLCVLCVVVSGLCFIGLSAFSYLLDHYSLVQNADVCSQWIKAIPDHAK